MLSVEFLRANGGNASALDPNQFCFRGLEPFETENTREQASLRRQIYQAVVLREQIRQKVFGIKDPQRYHVLTTEQSETALKRAQEQAAMDEHEAYNQATNGTSSFQVAQEAQKMDTAALLHLSAQIEESNAIEQLEHALKLQAVESITSKLESIEAAVAAEKAARYSALEQLMLLEVARQA